MTTTKWVRLGIVIAGALAVAQGQARQSQSQAGQFQVVRSASGSRGEQRGEDFVMSDPRSSFRYPGDKQVVVFFEWDGPTGVHHFQGTWRSPDGKVVSVGDVDYEAKRSPFQIHWTLNLPERVLPGTWSLEAQIDGQSAGVRTFQIQVDEAALQANGPSQAEIFKRAQAAMVFVESLDAAGNRLNRASGFFINPNMVVTAFVNIDGASSLDVELPGGAHVKVTEVAGWNRSLDWALLHVNAPDANQLEMAKPDSWGIGDVDYLMDAPLEGGRAIQPVQITGILNLPRGGQRIHLSWAGYVGAIGSPLLNLQGKVIGMLSGISLNVTDKDKTEPSNAAPQGLKPVVGGNPFVVVPIMSVTPMPPQGSPVPLAEMTKRGLFMAPLVRKPEIISATICASFRWNRYPVEQPIPEDVRNEFSRKDANMAVVVTWFPTASRKTTVELRIYDSENRMVGGGKPQEISLKRDQEFYSAREGSIQGLTPGVYRVEILAVDQVQWRQYFAVTE